MKMLLSFAHAQEAVGQAPLDSASFNLVPFILIVAVFYFFMIRPQAKKLKNHQEMLQRLSRNSKVVTAGGIVGKVVKVHEEDNLLEVEIAKDVVVTVQRSTITALVEDEKNAGKETAETAKGKPAKKAKK